MTVTSSDEPRHVPPKALVASVAAGLVVSLAACSSGSHPSATSTPAPATPTPSGRVLVATSGTGSKDLGHFPLSAAEATIDVQGSCVGSGYATIRVVTGVGKPLTVEPKCALRGRTDVQGIVADSTGHRTPISGNRVEVRVQARAHTTWRVAVSLPRS